MKRIANGEWRMANGRGEHSTWVRVSSGVDWFRPEGALDCSHGWSPAQPDGTRGVQGKEEARPSGAAEWLPTEFPPPPPGRDRRTAAFHGLRSARLTAGGAPPVATSLGPAGTATRPPHVSRTHSPFAIRHSTFPRRPQGATLRAAFSLAVGWHGRFLSGHVFRACKHARLKGGHATQKGGYPARRRAFSLAETLVSVILVGGLMVAALNTTAASVATQGNLADRGVGQMLAQELLAEILNQAYMEPIDPAAFGLELLELSTTRILYDDVDDYHGWTASPPQNKDGTMMSGLAGWRRTVTVRWVSPSDFSSVQASESGAKRIEVDVANHGKSVATLVAVRTDSAAVVTTKSLTPRVDPVPLPPAMTME